MTKKVIEARGSDVEAAIKSGLARLGVGRDAVEIEVLDQGSKGLLGIGARDAMVRLTTLEAEKPVEKRVEKPVEEPVEKPAPAAKPVEPAAPAAKVTAEPPPVKTAVSAPPPAVDFDEEGELEAEQATAVVVISTLLEKMGVDATVTTSLTDPDDVTGKRLNIIEVNGDDLSTLIGPRGETLNALQYISRLMVGHQLRTRAGFVVDVEGYRQRREQALARLAERMAHKVAKRKRAMTLEPMPPHERRIIHLTLRDDKYVYTESVGEGNRRKVRIIPKQS